MNGRTWTSLALIGAMTLGCLGLSQRPASADTKWAIRVGNAPQTYYVWETETRYRTVRRAVEHTYYRTERRAFTEYRLEWRSVLEHYRGRFGRPRTRQVRRQVRVPYTVYRDVRVPYTRTTYEWVREPYTVRRRVLKTAPPSNGSQVAVSVASGHWGFSLSSGGDRPQFAVSYDSGRDRRGRKRR